MKQAKITFQKCIQDSQDYGNNEEHMTSRIFFTLEISGQRYENLYVDIKQPVGSSYESGPIEVSYPESYKGPLNYEAFRNTVEQYYRSLVGSAGSGIGISGGGNIRMRNNIFIQSATMLLPITEAGHTW